MKDEFELRGILASLLCWHRLTQAEAEDLLRFVAAQPVQPAQPAQEPVGTLNISRYKGHLVNHDFDYFGELPDGTYSVYTAPPAAQPQRPWVDLTDKEIDAIYLQHHNQYGECESPNFGYERAIEAKLKKRNAQE